MTKRSFFKSFMGVIALVASGRNWSMPRAVPRPNIRLINEEEWRQLCALLACSEAKTILITHSELKEIARKAGQTERVFRIERKPRKYFR